MDFHCVFVEITFQNKENKEGIASNVGFGKVGTHCWVGQMILI